MKTEPSVENKSEGSGRPSSASDVQYVAFVGFYQPGVGGHVKGQLCTCHPLFWGLRGTSCSFPTPLKLTLSVTFLFQGVTFPELLLPRRGQVAVMLDQFPHHPSAFPSSAVQRLLVSLRLGGGEPLGPPKRQVEPASGQGRWETAAQNVVLVVV